MKQKKKIEIEIDKYLAKNMDFQFDSFLFFFLINFQYLSVCQFVFSLNEYFLFFFCSGSCDHIHANIHTLNTQTRIQPNTNMEKRNEHETKKKKKKNSHVNLSDASNSICPLYISFSFFRSFQVFDCVCVCACWVGVCSSMFAKAVALFVH